MSMERSALGGNNVFQKQNKRVERENTRDREEAGRKKQGGRRTRRRKEKSIQGAPDSASRRRISQQLPLIPSANTRNLNARGPGVSIHGRGKNDKEKFVRDRRVSMRFRQKAGYFGLSLFPSHTVCRSASCFIR